MTENMVVLVERLRMVPQAEHDLREALAENRPQNPAINNKTDRYKKDS